MCPVFNPDRSECTVTPADNAYQDGGFKTHYCTGGNHEDCGNYQSYKSDNYVVRR